MAARIESVSAVVVLDGAKYLVRSPRSGSEPSIERVPEARDLLAGRPVPSVNAQTRAEILAAWSALASVPARS